jgi:hypothetical protein
VSAKCRWQNSPARAFRAGWADRSVPVVTPTRQSDEPQTYGTPESESSSGPRRWLSVAILVVVALALVGMIVLHLSGALGPGLHGG